jgi:hypothetical protein
MIDAMRSASAELVEVIKPRAGDWAIVCMHLSSWMRGVSAIPPGAPQCFALVGGVVRDQGETVHGFKFIFECASCWHARGCAAHAPSDFEGAEYQLSEAFLSAVEVKPLEVVELVRDGWCRHESDGFIGDASLAPAAARARAGRDFVCQCKACGVAFLGVLDGGVFHDYRDVDYQGRRP